jgi:coenzyme F420-reducing hydrogenase gamma subunit
MVAHGTPCLGPVTHAGCGALCPSYDRGCYGCFGPMQSPNTSSLAEWFAGHGSDDADIVRAYRLIYAGSEQFGRESEAREHGS